VVREKPLYTKAAELFFQSFFANENNREKPSMLHNVNVWHTLHSCRSGFLTEWQQWVDPGSLANADIG
jgi:hypothetical protein